MTLALERRLRDQKIRIKLAAADLWIKAMEKMVPPQTPQELDQMMAAATKLCKMTDKDMLSVDDDDGKKSVADLQKELKGETAK